MHIRSILTMMKETQYFGAVLKKYRGILAPGRYYIYKSFRAMCLQNPKTRGAADKFFDTHPSYKAGEKTAALLNKISFFTNRNRRSSREYEAFYVANNADKNREIKLFSFQKKQILSICASQEAMKKQLNDYEKLGLAYKMPHTEKSSRYNAALEVAMVDRKPAPGENAALSAIARAAKAYNSAPDDLACKTAKEWVAFSYADEQMNAQLDNLAKCVSPSLLDCRMPMCLQHGDLSKDNLLYGHSNGCEDFWFIDWEHEKDRIFFYDYYFYILNSGIYGDTDALSCYLSGENDETLKTFFGHFGVEFCPDKRYDYFLIFAICFLKERVCDLGNLRTLEKYCDFIRAHSRMTEGDGKTQ